ncbi:hypothetical protein J437_LFUL017649 [Ladona fulva]|uniref:ubiquitinyl hydrolase 1 n=1 Tax=Ladona fulva TaxID=123851 RepID=A0A8K0KLT7_LADFU|nr:hypothetical protein J437_LFUL017649 [Ladona fulva]
MGEDGACLFRAVADQVFGDQEMHSIVRNQCMDFLLLNKDHYKQYMTEDLDAYVTRKRNDFVHGNHIELQALSEMFNRAIEVFSYGIEPINIFHGLSKPDNEPIRLSYHRGVHYNSIVDPYKATIGVGLGLPNFTPGLAEKNLMKEAVRQSEESEIEQAMLEDKLMATDWEATYEVMTEQAARESYLQWLKDNEKRNKAMHRASASATTSSTVTSADCRSARSGMNQRTCDRSPETSVKQDMMYPKLSLFFEKLFITLHFHIDFIRGSDGLFKLLSGWTIEFKLQFIFRNTPNKVIQLSGPGSTRNAWAYQLGK